MRYADPVAQARIDELEARLRLAEYDAESWKLRHDGVFRQLHNWPRDVENAYRRGVADGRQGHRLIGEDG